MSEKDILGVIIPPKYSLPTTRSQAEPKLINVLPESPQPSYNTIIFSKEENREQFVTTAHSIVIAAEETGAVVPLTSLNNAAIVTGDIAVPVENIPLPETLRGRKNGIISNERGTIAKQGDNAVIIISIHASTHPFTGEKLIPPNQETSTTALPGDDNMVQVLPSPKIEPQAITSSYSQMPAGPTVSQPAALDNLRYIRPLTGSELRQARHGEDKAA